MEKIRIKNVTEENIDDLCQICIPSEKREDPAFIKGMEEKRKWAMEMLQMWSSFAKLAYRESTPVGLIQYKPVPPERIIYIYCIYVPEKENWRKEVATKLLSSLIEDMKKPRVWFDNKFPLALVTQTFAGEKPGQYSARLFFTKKGFKQVGDDPDFLYYPLKKGFIYQPVKGRRDPVYITETQKTEGYIPQEEDKGKVLLIYGPSFCPFSYSFLKKAEQEIKEVAQGIPMRWISKSEEPEEVKKRGNVEGCFVNAKPIKSFVFDKENFQKEVSEALMFP
ncbi:MAG: GNAT family N-acetyltransferase [Acidobacteriota bacterium]